jgi:hypothetical protein
MEKTVVQCVDCRKKYRVPVTKARRRRQCKECGGTVTAPESDTSEDPYEYESAFDNISYDDEDAGSASGDIDHDDAGDYQPARRRKRRKSKSSKKRRKKQSGPAGSRFSVANGLRCVLVALLLSIAAWIAGFLPIDFRIASALLLVATVLAMVGQAMCLSAPSESGTRLLICCVIGLQVASLTMRIASFVSALFVIGSWLTSVAAFFLFVFALKRLAEFFESPQAVEHAEWILYWPGGLFVAWLFTGKLVHQLGEGLAGPMSLVMILAFAVVVVLMISHYIDLLGCLKERLDES